MAGLVLATGFWAGPAQAECRDGKAWPEARVVLGLYDSRDESEPRETRLHRFLEFPLSYLGYTVEYWDVANGVPSQTLASDIAAISTWFNAPLPNATAYENWAARVTGECAAPKWLVIDDPGTSKFGADSAERSAFFGRLGLSATGDEVLVGAYAAEVARDENLVGFESPYVIEPDRYRPTRALPEAKSHLRIAPDPDQPDQGIDLFVSGSQGAYLHGTAAITYDRRTGETFWIVDPFRLIGMVLGEALRPVPDVTTLNGRRMFFSTVLSEGWLSVMPSSNFGREMQIAAEILRDRVIVPYGDLPQTVSVLTGDFDLRRDERAAIAGRTVAEQLFAQKQVQVASNGNSLVRNWQFFARYDRDTETRQIDAFSAADGTDEVAGLLNIAVRNLKGAFANPRAGSDLVPNSPRKYTAAPFDLSEEISGSLAQAETLAPEGKPAAAFVWGGDARPFQEALAMVRTAGYRAIGGGGGIYNAFAPSLSNLSPPYATVAAEMQVYDGLSGDSAYTGFWTSPLHGFHMLRQTLASTETPRRLKPFHLVYSAQSMIDFGTRKAVEAALDLARSEPVIPVEATDYVDIVQGFRSFRAAPVGENAWRIENRGALQTVRFDAAGSVALDMQASSGVLGATRKGGSLYVALMPSEAAPVIALARTGLTAMQRDAEKFGLVESRWKIADLQQSDCGVQMSASGWGAGRMIFAGPAAASLALTVADPAAGGAVLQQAAVATDAEGVLDLALPPLQGQTVDIRLDRAC